MNSSIMIRNADGYFLAGKALFETRKNAVNFFAYYISAFGMNMAFACELYLKYLYQLENHGKNKRGHKLKTDLFDNLAESTRNLVKKDYQKWTSILSFDDCIKSHNETFSHFRYMHECNNLSIEPQSLYNLAVALKNTCTLRMEEINNGD